VKIGGPEVSTIEKQKWLEHLEYEYQMLQHAARRLDEIRDQLDWNAYFESFFVHARVLHDFLTDTNPRKFESQNHDAADYVPGFKGIASTEISNALNAAANRQIFHPGKQRVEGKKLDTEKCARIEKWISTTLKDFVDRLPPPFQWDWQRALAPATICMGAANRITTTNSVKTTASFHEYSPLTPSRSAMNKP
jgi:hypothetical protein